ncbi:MAG: FtsX-like permease family protein [Desulfobacterales bacterium]|nr:FtsX-like permease family protein [Desulfobacterales bacterium]
MRLSPLVRTCFRSSRSHPLRTFLLIFGIALGVAGVIAIDIAKTSVSRSFELSTAALTRRATHQIIGADFTVPQSLFVRLRTELGLEKTAPVITREVMVPELNNRTLTLMGIDPFSEAHFRDIRFAADQPGTEPDAGNIRQVMIRGDGIILSRSLAASTGLVTGDALTLAFGDRKIITRIGGLTSGGAAGAAFDGVILADIALAQEILGMGNRISRIDLKLQTADDTGQVQKLLSPGLILTETATRNQTVRGLSRSFETSLTAFSMLVLFMGIFLIYNTVSFSVARRRGLNGVLRALGATRKEIFLAVEAEVLVYALAGSALGAALGIVLGKGAVQAVTATVSDMYYTLTVSRTFISAGTLMKGTGIGILAALASSFMPALNAANTQPVTLMQRSASESSLARYIPGLAGGGLLALVFAVVIFNWPGVSTHLVFTGVFMVFAGASFLTPVLIIFLTRGAEVLLRKSPGRLFIRSYIIIGMAFANIRRSLSRSAVLIASLMVVVSVYIGIDTMTRSFRLSIAEWVDGHIGGDVHVSSPDELHPALDRELIDKISALPDVRDISAYTIHRAFSTASGEVHIFAYQRDLSQKKWVWQAPGIDTDADINRRLSEGWIIVSEIFARQHNMNPRETGGPVVTMDTRLGPRPFRVAGMFRDFFMGGGRVVASPETMKNFWGHDDITSIQVFVRDDAQEVQSPDSKQETVGRVMAQIRAFTPETTMLKIVSGLGIKQNILAVFDKTFLITSALQLLTAIVALTGIINSVMAMILERTRELGILRACGAVPGQVRTLVLWECTAAGALAGLFALPLGAFLSWVLIYVVNYISFGWTYDMQLSWFTLAQALTFSGLSAFLAGIIPAFRAGRLDIKNALRTE